MDKQEKDSVLTIIRIIIIGLTLGVLKWFLH